jgi:hypothetical protein
MPEVTAGASASSGVPRRSGPRPPGWPSRRAGPPEPRRAVCPSRIERLDRLHEVRLEPPGRPGDGPLGPALDGWAGVRLGPLVGSTRRGTGVARDAIVGATGPHEG